MLIVCFRYDLISKSILNDNIRNIFWLLRLYNGKFIQINKLEVYFIVYRMI